MTTEKLKHLNDLSTSIEELKKHYANIDKKSKMTYDYRFEFDSGSNEGRAIIRNRFLPMPKELYFKIYLANVQAEIEKLESEFNSL